MISSKRGLFVKRSTLCAAVFGGTVLFVGLAALASTFGQPNRDLVRATGTFLAGFGCLVAAIPLYVDARRMQDQFRAAQNSGTKRNLAPCALCGAPAATFRCTTHTLRLCPDCVPRHDDSARCLYKAMVRISTAKPTLAFPSRG